MAEVIKESVKYVTVGCKLPAGLHLDIFAEGKPRRRVTIKGSNHSNVIGGFGITKNVPADHFKEWMRLHAALPAVANGLIFAHAETDSVAGRAEEMAGERNGFEPMNPEEPGMGITALAKG